MRFLCDMLVGIVESYMLRKVSSYFEYLLNQLGAIFLFSIFFDKNVLKSNDLWLVEFFAPW